MQRKEKERERVISRLVFFFLLLSVVSYLLCFALFRHESVTVGWGKGGEKS